MSIVLIVITAKATIPPRQLCIEFKNIFLPFTIAV